MTTPIKTWRWREGRVRVEAAHFELRYGSADRGGWNDWLPVALIGRGRERCFVVQFLEDTESTAARKRREAVTKEIKFYLIDKREPNPWGYAKYHTTTAADAYSSVHWSYVPGR